jgi:hypothetical protein
MKTGYNPFSGYVYNTHYNSLLQQAVHNLLLARALIYANTQILISVILYIFYHTWKNYNFTRYFFHHFYPLKCN